MSTVQEAINEKLLEQQRQHTIYSKLSYDRKTIIIKAKTEEKLQLTYGIIENIEELKDSTEINYKEENLQKIRVTGIPKYINQEKIKNIIKQLQPLDNKHTIKYTN